jgi:hypothetical protein
MIEQWKEERYREVYDAVCTQLEKQKAEGKLTKEQLRGLLESAYVNQGNDFAGRGEAMNITIDATVAAYECFLADWQD